MLNSAEAKAGRPERHNTERGKTHHFTTADIQDGDEVEVGCVADQEEEERRASKNSLKSMQPLKSASGCTRMDNLFIYFIFRF